MGVLKLGGIFEFLGSHNRCCTPCCRQPRQKFLISTKSGGPTLNPKLTPNDGGLSRKHIIECVDESLQRLKTDYIDLYQVIRVKYKL